MGRRALLAAVLAVWSSELAWKSAAVVGPSATCAVTAPNHNPLPDAVRSKAAVPEDFTSIHGNGALWTYLWPDGTVVFKKGGVGSVQADGSLRMKFLWLLATDGPLTVTGRSLDGEARPITTQIPDGFVGKGFQPSYLIFPTVGCWEVTAQANGSALKFVTMVVKQGF